MKVGHPAHRNTPAGGAGVSQGCLGGMVLVFLLLWQIVVNSSGLRYFSTSLSFLALCWGITLVCSGIIQVFWK